MTSHPAWLQALLDDEKVTDICLNGAEENFFDRGLGMQPVKATWQAEEMRLWVLDLLSKARKTWDARHPFVDLALPSGHRLHIVFPGISTKGFLVSIRRLPTLQNQNTASNRWKMSPAFNLLKEAVIRQESVLVCGATGSGKTTLTTDLLTFVPPHERMIILEDTPEIHPDHPHGLALCSRPPNADGFGEISLRDLMRQALRMRPDRIILGECRGNEVLDLLQALNTGHRGSIATLHANSPRDALRRVELLCHLATGGKIASSVIREFVSTGIQWLAYVSRELRDGGTERKIAELVRVEGREGDTILLRPFDQFFAVPGAFSETSL